MYLDSKQNMCTSVGDVTGRPATGAFTQRALSGLDMLNSTFRSNRAMTLCGASRRDSARWRRKPTTLGPRAIGGKPSSASVKPSLRRSGAGSGISSAKVFQILLWGEGWWSNVFNLCTKPSNLTYHIFTCQTFNFDYFCACSPSVLACISILGTHLPQAACKAASTRLPT